ncbi:trace amine-associated receptor 13c-like [Ambystoma mexicanum]|uniref:trace amine-associated receptor 13c-like n=1 Tax=Ambystoma mexicanum TaxID=8296 RepID=UPI0037E8134B
MVPLAVTPDSVGNILLLVFHFCLATTIMVLNLGVFLCLALTRSFRKENRYIYMMSTCFSDFCTGVMWYYVGLFDVKESFPARNDTRFFSVNFLGLSYLVVIGAQADRYHAVISPVRYPQRMTICKTVLVIAGLWALAFLTLAVLNLSTTAVAIQIQGTVTLVMNCITLGIMIGLNIRLYLIAKYQLERDPATPEREAKRSSLYLIVVVAATFLLLWSPVFMTTIVCNFAPRKCLFGANEATNPVIILPLVNAALTPLLYVRGCTPLRQVVASRLLCKCCTRQR